MTNFLEILDICRRFGFLLNSSKSKLILGPVGALVSENLRNEWIYNNVINRDINVYLNINHSLKDSYNFAKGLCSDRLPFGVAQISLEAPKYKNNNGNEFDVYMQTETQVRLQTNVFVSPSTATQFFYNWQNQRRIWWRKISSSPGRYSLTDIQITDSNEQNVEITSSYAWGTHVVETINLNPNGHPELTKEELEVKDGRKKVQAHCITSTTHLFSMVLNFLCDAYDNTMYQGNQRPMFHFHRKTAPYKVTFAISTTDANTMEELNDLSLYLCKKLRKNHVSVLFLPNSSRTSLEAQYSQYDQLGIPYTVVLNDNTLKNGIVYLRSRDTTLKEQVHISSLETYTEQLLKNY